MSDKTDIQNPRTQHGESNILRTVPDQRAFYFYGEINSPLGVKASNLDEFIQTLGRIDASSIQFHSNRHDFENWIRMLGDDTLALQVESLGKASVSSAQL
ncbi:MAG: hypothetical protein ACREBS_02025, partial [Nitrososphaerales archaeon]